MRFHTLSIERFRGIRKLDINLERFNLVGGKNNVGKTALLEATFLILGAHNPQLPELLSRYRGVELVQPDASELWGWLFLERDLSKPITLKCTTGVRAPTRMLTVSLAPVEIVTPGKPTGDKGAQIASPPEALTTQFNAAKLVMEYREGDQPAYLATSQITAEGLQQYQQPTQSHFPLSIFVSTRQRSMQADAQRYSKLEETGRHELVVEALRAIEPNLKRLVVSVSTGVSSLRADVGTGRLIPLTMLGEGSVRLISILLSIVLCPGGLVLVDELDNGFHYSVLRTIWRIFRDAAEAQDVQFVATTHNWECIKAAHEVFSSGKSYDFSYHRLDRVGGDVSVKTYSKQDLQSSVEMNLETR